MKFIKNKKYSLLSTISKYSFIFILAFTLFAPLAFIDANTTSPGSGGNTNSGNTTSSNTSNKNNGTTANKITGIDFKITPPISVKTIPDFIEAVLNIVIVIGIPIVALSIVYCGFLFVQARGNSEQIKKAKGAIMYTLVGAFLLLGAWVLAKAIGNTVNDIISTT